MSPWKLKRQRTPFFLDDTPGMGRETYYYIVLSLLSSPSIIIFRHQCIGTCLRCPSLKEYLTNISSLKDIANSFRKTSSSPPSAGLKRWKVYLYFPSRSFYFIFCFNSLQCRLSLSGFRFVWVGDYSIFYEVSPSQCLPSFLGCLLLKDYLSRSQPCPLREMAWHSSLLLV